MSDNVEHIDFGSERRRLERMMGRLLGLAEKQREELERDPVRYYARAVDEIVAVQKHVRAIEDALRPKIDWADPPTEPLPSPRPIQIMEADYRRYRAAEEIVRSGPERPTTPPGEKEP